MTQTIKAIETQYKGYRFRSRLEARWAVFFDAMGIEWEYEKEGYELPDGIRYLPDFWLPECKTFAEIKPAEGGDFAKAKALAEITHNTFLLLEGLPSLGKYYYPGYVFYCNTGIRYFEMIAFSEIGTSGKIYVDHYGRVDSTKKRIDAAATAARSARFEHGETPTPTRKAHQ